MVTLASPEMKADVATATKLMLVVEYDGTRYYGFQLQADQPTIQGELETAIEKLTGERLRISAASRTDTGVHAQGQVVSFGTRSTLPPSTFICGLNYYLPADIAIKAARRVDDSFQVRRHALSREYRYQILNSSTRSPLRDGFAHRVTGYMDVNAMDQAAQGLIGLHDFASFTTVTGIKTVRRVDKVEVKREGELVVFDMIASSFLPHQVRNTIGALIRVGRGQMSIAEFHSIIDRREPGLAGPTAPACGLCLMQVNYAEGKLS
ncbi:MAG: tRNA pseudouridine(38-40) synthase TruA [Chloroflexota bacterium]|nr:tRNA pseudouridine(38-40) synthase TruA [Chloroflexota bacterium]